MGAMVGLPTDRVLPDDPVCRPAIELYARDQQRWFEDFTAAFTKMSVMGAVWT
jgi:L-ascorbate peroxidase